MATLFKPTRPYPLPANAEIVPKDGKPHVRLKERGKAALYPLSEDGKQYLKPAAKWAADVRFADGRRKRVRFSPNRDAAAVMLADLLKKIENERAGIRDEYADHRVAPLAELLIAYKGYLTDKGATPKEAQQTFRRCEAVFKACGFVLLRDLDAPAAERWLAERRRVAKKDGGFGAASSNHYTKSLKAFGNWLVKTRRCAEHPFRHLARVNAGVDVRHQRRALSADEFARLITAARAGMTFRRLAGPDRAALYLVAGMTGLRASELASLTPASFTLDAPTPVVVVEAGYSKHRRRDEVPLHPELVAELRLWLSGRPASELLWAGKWAKHNEAGDMIRRDLGAARSAWIAEATGEAAERRSASDFLTYRTREGMVADFHSLRHTFITNLVNAGVAPKEAKELARHSTITLTMDRYAHVGLRDTAAALARLTVPTGSRLPTEPPAGAIREQHREQQGAAKSAAEGGNGGERLRTAEETGAASVSTKALENKAIDGPREGSVTGEESTPGGTRTHTLPLRRRMLCPVELRARRAHSPAHGAIRQVRSACRPAARGPLLCTPGRRGPSRC